MSLPLGDPSQVRSMSRTLTLGVEEELFAVDPATHGLLADGGRVLEAARSRRPAGDARYSPELQRCMLEGKTGICEDLGRLRAELREMRQGLVTAAREEGTQVAAAGAFPIADWRTLPYAEGARYEHLAEAYRRLADEHMFCACHVHVGVEGREAAVHVVNRARPWLPVFLALSASSPFWMGEDTGYASYRSLVWECWPMAGAPPVFASYAHYRETVDMLMRAGVSFDAGQAFWDVRLGSSYETVEFRIADSCPRLDEPVLLAGLARALVRTCLDEEARGDPVADVSAELMRAARWRSARYGVGGPLLDPFSGALVAGRSLVDRLVEHVRPALEEAGDWDEVARLAGFGGGPWSSSADRQRRVLAETGRMEDVSALLVDETAT